MTEYARIREVDPSQYVYFFLDNMRNPLAIWEHAFQKHLSQAACNLLVVLASMPHEVFLSDLEKAFQSYNLAYAKQYHTAIGPQDFRSALKELEGDFLILDKEGHDFLVRYQNPSVADFIKEYLGTSLQEMLVLATSVVYYEQFRQLWGWQGPHSGRDALIQLFTTDTDSAVLLMRHLLSSDPCRLIRVVRGRDSGKERWPIPLEERAAHVAGLIADSYSIFLPLLKDAVQELGHRLQEGKADRNGVGKLIEQMIRMKESDEEWVVNFRSVGIRFLMTTPNWADELRPLCRLVEEYPELFSDEDREAIKDVVREVAGSITSNYYDLDPEALREEVEALESIAIKVGVDIDEEINAIRHRADEVEDRRREDSAELEYSSNESSVDDQTSDDYIASLFSTLDVTP